jgi:S-adenosyl-L-methionine hydrolase (adenosine-forming)
VNIVSLLTDFGLKDPYVGIMKGVMLTINPALTVVDVAHQIEPQDVREAAFVIPDYYRFFPPATVHLCVVDPTVGSARKPLAVLKDGYIFVGPDNGLFSFLLDGATVYEISNEAFTLHPASNTFHGRDVFAPVAAHLSLGLGPELLGPLLTEPVRLSGVGPIASEDTMIGEIVRFDHFGNAISNIPFAQFRGFVRDLSFKVELQSLSFDRISKSYYEGTYVCIFGSSGYLEFAVFGGDLRQDKEIRKGDTVTVRRGAVARG